MKQNHDHNVPEQRKQRGQSLVEVALFLPILIIIIAGVIEVSQLLITQNRINTASRAATRFGASGGENEGIRRVALGNVTDTLNLDEALWDMWVLRGQVNEAGNNVEQWEFEHVYGISNTVRFSAVDQENLRQRVLQELSVDGRSPADLQFVGTYVQHDVNTILGLDALPWLAGYNSIASLNVMRIVGQTAEVTRGCDAFPLTINEHARSATEPGTQGGSAYPTNFHPNSPSPSYYSFVPPHVPNKSLLEAEKGYVFAIREHKEAGGFGFVAWNEGATGATVLRRSMAWPGNSQDYLNRGNDPNYQKVSGSPFDHSVRGYLEPGDPTDTTMNVNDWIAASTGNMNSEGIFEAMLEHIKMERHLRVIVWGGEPQGTGSNLIYQIKGFAVFQLHGIATVGSTPAIIAEFISWDTSCGQN
jgi:hypothetical protein